MDKLKHLFALCKSEVYITHNEHKGLYMTIDQFLSDRSISSNIPADIREEMNERNSLVEVRAYPQTPIGFYVVYHWAVESAVDQMIDIIQNLEN